MFVNPPPPPQRFCTHTHPFDVYIYCVFLAQKKIINNVKKKEEK